MASRTAARGHPKQSKSTGLYGRFNILHYLVGASIGLFIGGCGGCVIGASLTVGAAQDPTVGKGVGRFGAALMVFGPFIGASFAMSLIWLYDLNRRKKR